MVSSNLATLTEELPKCILTTPLNVHFDGPSVLGGPLFAGHGKVCAQPLCALCIRLPIPIPTGPKESYNRLLLKRRFFAVPGITELVYFHFGPAFVAGPSHPEPECVKPLPCKAVLVLLVLLPFPLFAERCGPKMAFPAERSHSPTKSCSERTRFLVGHGGGVSSQNPKWATERVGLGPRARSSCHPWTSFKSSRASSCVGVPSKCMTRTCSSL